MRIQVKIGTETAQSFAIDKNEMSIGSSKKSDIMISLPEISRQHAIILKEGERYYIIDNGSTNGTWINEEKVEPGKRTEITTYFNFRLAQSVVLSLVNEDLTGATQMQSRREEPIPAPMKAKGREQTKTELILDFKRPKGKAKQTVPVVTETKIETNGGLVKGLLFFVILAAVVYYVYHTFV